MSNHKARLQRLEKRREAQPVGRVDVIETIKHYEDGREVIEVIDLRTAKPSQVLARADELVTAGAQPTAEQAARIETLRQVIR